MARSAGRPAPAPPPMLPFVGVFLGSGVLAASALGLGSAVVLAGMTAMFLGMAAFGGSLHADLRLLAVLAPVTVLVTTLPRLLEPVATWSAVAVVVATVFVAGLLPARGRRYVSVATGLCLATLMSFGLRLTTPVSGAQVALATAVGAAVVVVLRLLAGLRDPSGPTRRKIADVFVAPDPPPLGAAFVAVLRDRPRRWFAEALGAGAAYRMAVSARRAATGADPHALGAPSAGAAQVADLVSARRPDAASPATPDVADAGRGGTVGLEAAALARARAAATTRDERPVDLPPGVRRELLRAASASPLTWRSDTLRHAVRTALGVLGALVLCEVVLEPTDPLRSALLMTTSASCRRAGRPRSSRPASASSASPWARCSWRRPCSCCRPPRCSSSASSPRWWRSGA